MDWLGLAWLGDEKEDKEERKHKETEKGGGRGRLVSVCVRPALR
jgi:hypothetical protein